MMPRLSQTQLWTKVAKPDRSRPTIMSRLNIVVIQRQYVSAQKSFVNGYYLTLTFTQGQGSQLTFPYLFFRLRNSVCELNNICKNRFTEL